MIKKFFPAFFVLVLVIALFSYFQKNNPTIQNIIDSKKGLNKDSISKVNEPTTVLEKIFLLVDEPKSNITVNNPIMNISGKTIANAYIFINEQELKADINGNFVSATTLEEGENFILVVVSDDLGNSVEKDILVNLETIQ